MKFPSNQVLSSGYYASILITPDHLNSIYNKLCLDVELSDTIQVVPGYTSYLLLVNLLTHPIIEDLK